MRAMEEVALPKGLAKVLAAAEENGWTENPAVSIVARLHKPGDPLARPFYVSYWLVHDTATGKSSWRFHDSHASNGQGMNYRDIFMYLEDPAVIHPEPPIEEGIH